MQLHTVLYFSCASETRTGMEVFARPTSGWDVTSPPINNLCLARVFIALKTRHNLYKKTLIFH